MTPGQQFVASIVTPPGYDLGPQQEKAIADALEKWLAYDLFYRQTRRKVGGKNG